MQGVWDSILHAVAKKKKKKIHKKVEAYREVSRKIFSLK